MNERLNGSRYSWLKDENGNYPCNRFHRGILINILEFYQLVPEYNINYYNIFELPTTYLNNKGEIVAITGMKPYEDNRFETGSSHSSASGYSDVESRSRSSSVNSV